MPSQVEEIVAEDSQEDRNSLLDCAELFFLLSSDELADEDRLVISQKFTQFMLENEMAPYYRSLSGIRGVSIDELTLTRMDTSNSEKIKKAESEIENAEKNMGESEVRDSWRSKSKLLASIGDRDGALKAFEETFSKSVGSNSKLEIVFDILQFALFLSDLKIYKKEIDRAHKLLEEGGDWERRNQLKVYEATYLMSVRDLAGAANLFIDSIATFSCSELFSYNTFIFYTVVTCTVSLDRVQLRDKVVEAPEILSVIGEIKNLSSFLTSLYRCEYSNFFPSLGGIMKTILRDQYLARHASHYLREIRSVVYSQFLESYQSVTIRAMAKSFGVSEEFLDRELSHYIANGRLNAKIDKVRGVVETNRPDAKNAQYQSIIKQGDLLLNRVQKLSRVITF